MNAIDLLKADHDRVETLFKRFKDNGEQGDAELSRQIRNELTTHTHIEEAIFYPACLKRGKADLKKIVREGLEEHAQVKELLADLAKMTSRNRQFDAKLKVVVENVEHHVGEEEDDMFPMCEDQFSETQLEKLGAEMEAEKVRYQQTHRIKPAPQPKGAITKLVEKTTQVVSDLFGGTNGQAKRRGRAANGKSNGKSARAKSTASPKSSDPKAAKSAASQKRAPSKGSKSKSRSSANR